jgi:hypothetical protein
MKVGKNRKEALNMKPNKSLKGKHKHKNRELQAIN